MKILYHHRIRSKDGQFVHLQELVHAFEKNGHSIKLVGPSIVQSASFGAGGGFSDVLRRWLPGFCFELLEFFYGFLALARLVRAVKEYKPDFIYERFNLFFPFGVFVAKRMGVPLVLEVNGPLFEERSEFGGISLKAFAKWTQHYTWRNASLLLPVTNVMGDFLRAAGVDNERILVIPNGVDLEHFERADNQVIRKQYSLENKLILGFTGFVRPWHGVDTIIQAIADGVFPNSTCLVLVGDGPALNDLKKQAESLKVSDRVIFCGLVERELIPNYVASFDIALQPAVVAWASPLKVIEYLAVGAAIVAPTQPNICEILQHEKNCLLFDPNDGNTRIQAIARLCNDEELRLRLGHAARASIDEQRLTWISNAQKIVERAIEMQLVK